jgi:hypothetical protein
MALQLTRSRLLFAVIFGVATVSDSLPPALRADRAIGAEATQTSPVVVPYRSDSFVSDVNGKNTGFFHVEQRGETWWVVDPLGRGFVPLGVDHVSFQGHGCEKLGYAPYGRKNQAKYGSSARWAEETLARLHGWGFNLLGAGCSPELQYRGLAHTAFVAFGTDVAGMGDAMDIMPNRHIPGSAFPNVFHPEFEALCRKRARRACSPHVADPWLFGYFLDNELAWWGETSPDTGLFDAVMRKSASHTAKLALCDFLAKRYNKDIGRFNEAWGVHLESFDQLRHRDSISGSRPVAVAADKKAFVAVIGQRYFSAIARSIRAFDPNHMILGCRFAGGACSSDVWRSAGRYCDIVSFNYYGKVDLTQGIARDDTHDRRGKPLVDVFQTFYDRARRPLMVTEWSFPAIDAGVPSVHGAGQRFRTQAQRARATEITERTMLALPFLIGHDYFMWVDEPALGISQKFPEDSNYGLVNEDGKPYELLTDAFTRVHREVGRLRREGLARAGVEVRDSRVVTSALAKFIERHRPALSPEAKPHIALRFDRQGDEFIATNGPLEIRGKIGGRGLTEEVRHNGLVMGQFSGMVHQYTEQNEWMDVERLAEVRAAVGPRAMSIDLVGRYEAPPQSSRRSFELAYRLILLPKCDWFVAQWLGCRNTDARPMNVRGILSRLYSRIAGSAADDLPANVTAVPHLWGGVNGDAWVDAKAQAFWGLAADDVDLLKIHFYVDEPDGQQHPDALFELDRQLAPQETYRPTTPVGVLCVAGRGDGLQWEATARKALDSLNSR